MEAAFTHCQQYRYHRQAGADSRCRTGHRGKPCVWCWLAWTYVDCCRASTWLRPGYRDYMITDKVRRCSIPDRSSSASSSGLIGLVSIYLQTVNRRMFEWSSCDEPVVHSRRFCTFTSHKGVSTWLFCRWISRVRENAISVTILGPPAMGKSTMLRNCGSGFSGRRAGAAGRETGAGARRRPRHGGVSELHLCSPGRLRGAEHPPSARRKGASEAVQKERSDYFIVTRFARVRNHHPKQPSAACSNARRSQRALANDPKILLMTSPSVAGQPDPVLMQELLLGIWEAERKTGDCS